MSMRHPARNGPYRAAKMMPRDTCVIIGPDGAESEAEFDRDDADTVAALVNDAYHAGRADVILRTRAVLRN